MNFNQGPRVFYSQVLENAANAISDSSLENIIEETSYLQNEIPVFQITAIDNNTKAIASFSVSATQIIKSIQMYFSSTDVRMMRISCRTSPLTSDINGTIYLLRDTVPSNFVDEAGRIHQPLAGIRVAVSTNFEDDESNFKPEDIFKFDEVCKLIYLITTILERCTHSKHAAFTDILLVDYSEETCLWDIIAKVKHHCHDSSTGYYRTNEMFSISSYTKMFDKITDMVKYILHGDVKTYQFTSPVSKTVEIVPDEGN